MACRSLNKVKIGDDIGEVMLCVSVGVGAKRQTFSIHKALLQKVTKFFDKHIASENGQMGMIFLKDDNPELFKMFYDWLYTGNIPKAPTQFTIKKLTSEAEIQRLENELRQRFDAHVRKLVLLYCLGEKYDIDNFLNNIIDKIQDAFHEYGTVFGPALLITIFEESKKGSKLRELCIAANVIHTDRGCCQLRMELMMASRVAPEFFSEMMMWISRNFVMFGRRQSEGFDVMKPTQGFSMLNRKKLCPCHFHRHASGEAHKNHKKCAVPFMTCGHEKEDEGASEPMDAST